MKAEARYHELLCNVSARLSALENNCTYQWVQMEDHICAFPQSSLHLIWGRTTPPECMKHLLLQQRTRTSCWPQKTVLDICICSNAKLSLHVPQLRGQHFDFGLSCIWFAWALLSIASASSGKRSHDMTYNAWPSLVGSGHVFLFSQQVELHNGVIWK